MAIYFSTETDKLKPYVQDFEAASTGEKVRTTVIEALKYANVLHSKRFGRTAVNE